MEIWNTIENVHPMMFSFAEWCEPVSDLLRRLSTTPERAGPASRMPSRTLRGLWRSATVLLSLHTEAGEPQDAPRGRRESFVAGCDLGGVVVEQAGLEKPTPAHGGRVAVRVSTVARTPKTSCFLDAAGVALHRSRMRW